MSSASRVAADQLCSRRRRHRLLRFRSPRRLLPAHLTCFHSSHTCPCRFGGKADAVQLLQEWVQQIGSEAGLTPDNTSLSTGRRVAVVLLNPLCFVIRWRSVALSGIHATGLFPVRAVCAHRVCVCLPASLLQHWCPREHAGAGGAV